MKKITEGLEAGHSRISACSMADVPHTTFMEWLRRGRIEEEGQYKDFVLAAGVAEGIGEARYANVVIKEARTGNWKAAMFMLQKRYHWS